VVVASKAIIPKTLLFTSHCRYLDKRDSAKTNSPIIEAERIMATNRRKSKKREEIVIDLVFDNSNVNVEGIKKVNIANATEATFGLNQEP
jgi:hypothetical protein